MNARRKGAPKRDGASCAVETSAPGRAGRFRAGPGPGRDAIRGALSRSCGHDVPDRVPCDRHAASHCCRGGIDPAPGRAAAPGSAGMRRSRANRGHRPATAAITHSLQQPGTAVSHWHLSINAASGHHEFDYRCAGSPSVDPEREHAARRGSDGHRPDMRAADAGSRAAGHTGVVLPGRLADPNAPRARCCDAAAPACGSRGS